MTDESADDSPLRRIDHKKLLDLVEAVYRSTGVPDEDARLVADTMVQADLWGHQSHGVLRLEWYYNRLRNGAMKPMTRTSLVSDTGTIAVMDGADGLGQVIAMRALEESLGRAREHGVGIVSVRHSNHFGTCMYFTRKGASRGFITWLMSNGGPNMAPWGGRQKVIGTNPWSIAVPGGKYGPVVMDMANSGVARGKIYIAQKRKEPIPDHWAIDAMGLPTTDPGRPLKVLSSPWPAIKAT